MLESRENRPIDEIDLMNYIAPVIASWKLLLVISVIGGIAAFFYSRTQPKIYQSNAIIYVQQASAGANLLRGLPIAVAAGGGGTNGYLTTVLSSDSLARKVVTRLNLTKNPGFVGPAPRSVQDTVEMLRKGMEVTETKSGSLTIALKAYDPDVAAKVLNDMLDSLGSVVVTASQKKANFISARLEETSRDLDTAESKLTAFLEKHSLAAIQDDAKSMIQQLSSLEASLLELDTKLEAINSELSNAGDLTYLTEQEVTKKSLQASRDYVAAKRDELRAKLAGLPDIAMQYARLQRDTTVLAKTYELLTEQYQLANITKKGEDGDYQIVDRARPVYKKVAPSNVLNAATGFMMTFMVGAVLVNIRTATTNKRRSRRMPASPRTIPDIPTEETAKRT